jgi:hypothetical protein
LVEQWRVKGSAVCGPFAVYIATQAAQWGADQELEACCEWLDERVVLNGSTALRHARRPKPPSLKEQALAALKDDDIDVYLIRRALEALPDN